MVTRHQRISFCIGLAYKNLFSIWFVYCSLRLLHNSLVFSQISDRSLADYHLFLEPSICVCRRKVVAAIRSIYSRNFR